MSDEDPLAWMAQGACRKRGLRLFFGQHKHETAIAKLICHTECADEVREACLGYALGMEMIDGVWGGTSPDDRKPLLRAGAGKFASHGTVRKARTGCDCGPCKQALADYRRDHRRASA